MKDNKIINREPGQENCWDIFRDVALKEERIWK